MFLITQLLSVFQLGLLNTPNSLMLAKRLFDIGFSLFGLLFLGWLILLLSLISFFDCCGKGFFTQTRIGQYAASFKIYKIRTMHKSTDCISGYGRFLRKYKLDELPQLVNILLGQMSFVGPRPDVPGYYDRLEGEDRKILKLKPGLCSRAALRYYNEEHLLSQQQNPLQYNDKVIFPDKVRMNLNYFQKISLREDLSILLATSVQVIGQIFEKR